MNYGSFEAARSQVFYAKYIPTFPSATVFSSRMGKRNDFLRLRSQFNDVATELDAGKERHEKGDSMCRPLWPMHAVIKG